MSSPHAVSAAILDRGRDPDVQPGRDHLAMITAFGAYIYYLQVSSLTSQTIHRIPKPTIPSIYLKMATQILSAPAPLGLPLPMAAEAPTLSQKLLSLRRVLSAGASINEATDPAFKAPSGWSDINPITAGAFINVATEQDVVASITWATTNSVPFHVRGSGHMWINSLPSSGVVINTRPLASITIDAASGTATIGAGTLVSEATEAAHAAHFHLSLAASPSVSVIGSTLGGGLGAFQGLYGLSIDSLVSARVVTAAGKLLTVTPELHQDLYYALRGAGNTLVAVTEITMRTYPEINGGMHFSRDLYYSPSAIEAVAEAVNALPRVPNAKMQYYMASPAPNYEPTLILNIYYAGTAAEGLEHFASLLALGPTQQIGEADSMISADRVNDSVDELAVFGGRKPAGSVMLKDLDPKALRACWNDYYTFVKANPTASDSVVAFQIYDVAKSLELEYSGNESAYPHRQFGIVASVVAKYEDERLDAAAVEFVNKTLELLTPKQGKNVYYNISRGGETLEELFGSAERVERLKEIKKAWDPENQFKGFASLV
ncbi:hypothetical protein V490_05716 [Pseudogymnoascus sp. VKM F-3557]|nr:hypothetical protein V490_05716 [Pseudogymnoascus sp. VKM F-3557]